MSDTWAQPDFVKPNTIRLLPPLLSLREFDHGWLYICGPRQPSFAIFVSFTWFNETFYLLPANTFCGPFRGFNEALACILHPPPCQCAQQPVQCYPRPGQGFITHNRTSLVVPPHSLQYSGLDAHQHLTTTTPTTAVHLQRCSAAPPSRRHVLAQSAVQPQKYCVSSLSAELTPSS